MGYQSRYQHQDDEIQSLENKYFDEKTERELLKIRSEVELSTLRQELAVAETTHANEIKDLQNDINLLGEGRSETEKLLERKSIENKELKLGLDQMKIVEGELQDELDHKSSELKTIGGEMIKMKSDFEI